MSFINKLQIRGIRSFGPDQDENIEFYSPLTMIVGQNGCGKTTIIESLKFACTGILPPNAQKGQSMVNDPGMTDTAEVKAHIKLLFKNRAGRDCLAIRSLQVTKKKKKLEFKALEGVLKTTNDLNEPVSSAHRCSEMDKMIPENLGVSPAILENVIFVHQEESNWPLQEGAVLKKKFDDVFESTRYTQALEALAKTKKGVQAKAKELKAELGELSAHLAAATMSRKELQDNQSNQDNCEEEIVSINQRLEATENKLKDTTTSLEQARERLGVLEKLQWKLKEAERRIVDKRAGIETMLTRESDEELQSIMNNFSNEMDKRQRELQQVTKQVDALKADMETVQHTITQLNVKKGQGDFLQQDIQKVKTDLIVSLQALSRKHAKLSPFTTSLTVSSWNSRIARDVLNVLNQELQSLQEEHSTQLSGQKAQIQEMEKTCQDFSSKISKLDMETNYKTEESRGMATDIEKKRSELLRLTSSRALLTTKQQEFDDAQRNYDEFMSQFQTKTVDIKRQTKEVTDELHQLQEQIANDSRLLQELSFHRQEMTTLDVQTKSIEQDKLEIMIDIEGLFSVNRDVLMKATAATKWATAADLLVALKTVAGLETWTSQWTTEVQQSQQRFKSTQQQHLQLKSDAMAKDTLYQQYRDRLQQLNPKLSALQDFQRQVQPFIQQLNTLRSGKFLSSLDMEFIPMDRKIEDVLHDTKFTEEEIREMLVVEKAGKKFLKRFKKFRQQNPNQCPCCAQDMTAGAAVQRYEQRIQEIFMCEGNSVEELEESLTMCTEVYKGLQDLQKKMLPLLTVQADVAACEQEVTELQQQKTVMETEIAELAGEVESLEEHAQLHSKLHTSLQDLLFRFKQVEQKRADLQDRKRRQQQSLLAATASSAMSSATCDGLDSDQFRNLDELEKQVQRQLEHKDSLQAKKEKLAAEEGNLMKKSYALKSLLNDYEKSLNDAKFDGNKAGEIEVALTTLQQKLSEIEARKQIVVREKEGLLRQLQEHKSALQSKKTEFEQRETTSTTRLTNLKQDRDNFNRQVESCEELERKLQDLQVPQIEAQLQDLQWRLAEHKARLQTEWVPRVQELQQALASQEQTKRNVAQNIELRQIQKEFETLQTESEHMQAQYGGGQGQQELQRLKQQQEQLQRDKQNWASQYHQINGKLAVYSQNIQELQKKLSGGLYKGIEEKYRVKNIEYETTNIAVVDLTNYYNALDRALQNFHTLKIKEINKIIRELWQMTYQGQDIDNIELESGIGDLEGDGATATSASGSRSYNYRVVMRKGDLPLDMRGRCSAGQKVLAAIVIRLALAETFCLNCGILALDEPTTNLDEPNKHGLARALARLIIARSKQQNFQLICITHDEDFVQMMKNELAEGNDFALPEFYFRIFRSEDRNSGRYFSHIERIPWEDM